jgi:hypothetical protein
MDGWMEARARKGRRVKDYYFFSFGFGARERMLGVVEDRVMGSGRWGSNVGRGTWLTSCAPPACIMLIEWRTSEDAVSVRSGEQNRTMREERQSDVPIPRLGVTLVDAEHCNESPQVIITMRRLLADYHPNGMRDTLSICLGERNCVRGSGKRGKIRLVQGKIGEAWRKNEGSVFRRRGVKREK